MPLLRRKPARPDPATNTALTRASHMAATMQGDGLSPSVERQVAESDRQRAFDRNSRAEERQRRRIRPVAWARSHVEVTRILLIEQIFRRPTDYDFVDTSFHGAPPLPMETSKNADKVGVV